MTQDQDLHDPVPSSIRELLETWSSRLPDVRFPQVDGDVLVALAEDVRVQSRAVDEARVALDEARAAFEESRRTLRTRALQGLAYAKVYAEGDPELAQHLNSIGLGRSPRTDKKSGKKRSRRKAVETEEETKNAAVLPFEQPPAGVAHTM